MIFPPFLVAAIEDDLKVTKQFRGYYPNSTDAYYSYLPFPPEHGSETYRIATSNIDYADPVRNIIWLRLDYLKRCYGKHWKRDTDGEKEEFPYQQGKCKHGLIMAWDEDGELNGDDCGKCGRYREEIFFLRRLDEGIYRWKKQEMEEEEGGAGVASRERSGSRRH